MNWTMPYPWRSRRDSVRRINMSSEPGNESFFCALRPIPRILSLRPRDDASQVQIGSPSRRKMLRPMADARKGAVQNILNNDKVFIVYQYVTPECEGENQMSNPYPDTLALSIRVL